jgi:acetylornithine deacetylase
VPPETANEFRASLERHLREWIGEPFAVSVALAERETPFLGAFATDADAPPVDALADAARVTTDGGAGDERAGSTAAGGDVRAFGAATESAYFAAVAPTVVFGPGDLADAAGAVAHAEREYVRVRDVRRAARALSTALSDLV